MLKFSPSVEKTESDDITAMYTVQGVSLGRTTLQFEARQKSSKVVSSQPKDIQVFPPLRLEPRNTTLIVGAIFQVSDDERPFTGLKVKLKLMSG